MSVSFNVALSGTGGLCHRPIPSPEESYRVCCVCVLSLKLNNEAAYFRVKLLRHKKKDIFSLKFYDETTVYTFQ
jgi:hypothetical protein